MFLALYVLILIESMVFVVLFVPFGVLAFVELVRAAQSPGREGLPSPDLPGPKMTRWHIVAAILAIGSVLIPLIQLTFDVVETDGDGLVATRSSPGLAFGLAEALLWFATLTALFGPMYAVRLNRQRVQAAGLIGFGVSMLPVIMLIVATFDSGAESESLAALAIAGAILFPLGIAVPWSKAKTPILASSCVVMLIAISEVVGPGNSIWLLAMLAMGYIVFRAEWKRMLVSRPPTVRAKVLSTEGPDAVTDRSQPTWGTWGTSTIRTVTFIVVNGACVVALWIVWRIVSGGDDPAPAVIFAAVGLAIAVCGAVLTTLAPILLGQPWSGIDHAAATFVVLLAIATVMHLIAAPQVDGFASGTSAVAQIWKPVLGTFACFGALAIALTTLTGMLQQIRPLMIVLVLPAAFLLPSDSFFTFLREDSLVVWSQRLIEAGITAIILAVMWYAFGPGRRLTLEQGEAILDCTRDSKVVVSLT